MKNMILCEGLKNNNNNNQSESFDQKFGKSNDTFTSQGFGNWSNKWISGN